MYKHCSFTFTILNENHFQNNSGALKNMLENLKYVIFYGSLHNFIKIQSSSYFGLNAKPEIQILCVI